jgi:hydrogenase maturation protease
VLGLGNCLLRDDGLGPHLLAELSSAYPDSPIIEFVDGGTQGLALLGYLCDRTAVVILDAVSLHRPPGTVTILSAREVLDMATGRATTAHEGNAGQLLVAAALLGQLPQEVIVVGIEPGELHTGLGLSQSVTQALPEARAAAACCIETLLAKVAAGQVLPVPCAEA